MAPNAFVSRNVQRLASHADCVRAAACVSCVCVCVCAAACCCVRLFFKKRLYLSGKARSRARCWLDASFLAVRRR
eukprot:7241589-Heterocapsa_arctica.AAC.1